MYTYWLPVQEIHPLILPIDRDLPLALRAALLVCTPRCQRIFSLPFSFLKCSQNLIDCQLEATVPVEWVAVYWLCWHWIYGLMRAQCCCRPMITLNHSQSWCWVTWEYAKRCLSCCTVRCEWNGGLNEVKRERKKERREKKRIYMKCTAKIKELLLAREKEREVIYSLISTRVLQSRDMMKSVFCRVFFRFTDNGVVCISILWSLVCPPILLLRCFYLLPLFIWSSASWVSTRHTETCSSVSNITDENSILAWLHPLKAYSIIVCLMALDFRWRNNMLNDDGPW